MEQHAEAALDVVTMVKSADPDAAMAEIQRGRWASYSPQLLPNGNDVGRTTWVTFSREALSEVLGEEEEGEEVEDANVEGFDDSGSAEGELGQRPSGGTQAADGSNAASQTKKIVTPYQMLALGCYHWYQPTLADFAYIGVSAINFFLMPRWLRGMTGIIQVKCCIICVPKLSCFIVRRAMYTRR
jgi:hypothetical protein